MTHDRIEPTRLDDSDCDAAIGDATPLMMGVKRIAVTKPTKVGEVDESGKCFCYPAHGSVAASGPIYPAAWGS